jgi:RimJ/RimL family protein N-acetyltransferase
MCEYDAVLVPFAAKGGRAAGMRAKDVQLKGPRVMIRPLSREDLDAMSAWPCFDDPLYQLFDWPKRSVYANRIWYENLVNDPTRVYYAVEDEGNQLIGRISLRQIQGRRSARLGIGFGKDYVGHRYGTEALSLFLHHYFLELGFERMVLDVAAVNVRALRLYRGCGFRSVGSHYEYAGSDSDVAFLQEGQYRHLRRFFRKKKGRHWMLSYDMVLDRENWVEQQAASG